MEFNLSQISESPVHCAVSRVGVSVPLTCTQQRIFFVHVGNAPNLLYLFVEIKCQLDATEVFIADLIACSTCFGHHYAHHQELKSIIQWLLRVVFCAVFFQVAGLVWR